MIYTKDQIKENLAKATSSQTEEQFIAKMTSSISKILKKDPARYRYYGVFWWGVKQALLDADTKWIDDSVDKEWLDKASFGDTASNLIASWMYAEDRMNSMETPSSSSVIEIKGENKEYILSDYFMDGLASV